MNIPTMAPGCLEHLESLKEFFRYSAAPIAFCIVLSQAPRPSLQSPDSPGCQRDRDRLRDGRTAQWSSWLPVKLASTFRPSRSRVAKSDSHISICVSGRERLACSLKGPFDVVILSDVLNYAADVEVLLRRLHASSHRGTRLLINVYNTLWRPLLGSARRLGLAAEQPASNWLSRQDVINLCRLADWEVFKSFGAILMPLPLGPLSTFVNRCFAPFFGSLCLSIFLIARRSGLPRREPEVVSVVIPARNEAGSIGQAIERVPRLGQRNRIDFY